MPIYKEILANTSLIVLAKATDNAIDPRNPIAKIQTLILFLNLGFTVKNIVKIIKTSPPDIAAANCHLDI